MKKLEKPKYENIENDYMTCIDNSRQKELLERIKPKILQQVKDYDNICSEKDKRILIPLSIDKPTKEILYRLYDNNFLAKSSNGRKLYDKLLLSSQVCPYCKNGIVYTLDHYLPRTIKDGFPELSIISLNLVPCCRDCNSLKHDDIGEQTKTYLHPYYDDVSKERWLYARVVYENNGPIIHFFVKSVASYSDELNSRIQYHFDKLNISRIYSINSGIDLCEIIRYIKDNKMSEDNVKAHLKDLAIINENIDKNSRKTAMYYALLEDSLFYQNCIIK